VSASAEVYVSITTENAERFSEVVDHWLAKYGFPTSGEDYRKASLDSGDVYEVRGITVSYDVFGDSFPEEIVKNLFDLRPELDVEVYVYNLDREADAMCTTDYYKQLAGREE